MGGFASSAVTVGRSLLGPALTVYGAYSDAKSRSAPARVAFDDGGVLAAAEANARAAEQERIAYEQTRAEQDAAELRRAAAAEAEWRARLQGEIAGAERDASERWNAYHLGVAEQEAQLAEAQARAAADADERRLQAQAAEAARLREADLKRAQASARARFGAAGLRGSTSAAALMTGMVDEAAARDAAAADTTAASARDLWAQVERTRERNLLALGQMRQRALLTMGDLTQRQQQAAAELAHDNELALYRADSAANRLLADAWMQTRVDTARAGVAGASAAAASASRATAPRLNAADFFLPLAGRLLSNL